MIKEFTREYALIVNHVDLAEATGEPDAVLEPYQILMLNDQLDMAIVNKSRQVGISWTLAARQLAKGIINPRHKSVFVSINKGESKEKITYAKHIIEAMDPRIKPKIIIGNVNEIELQNGSRLISHAARPVRGKDRADVILDEWAHYPTGREIFSSSLPATSRGGDLIGASSPMGAGGKFWEVFTQELQPYPGFNRYSLPWWLTKIFCKDPIKAMVDAPGMSTQQRVAKFARPRLLRLYANMPLDAFQQEFECMFVDEVTAWITWDEIRRNQQLDHDGRHIYYLAKIQPAAGFINIDKAINMIDALAQRINSNLVESSLVGGYDVGRHRNASELTLLGESMTGALPFRLGITLQSCEFDDQEAVLKYAMDNLPIRLLLIDKNGIGEQLSENMHKIFGDRAQQFTFSNPSKALLATEIKVRLQKAEIPLPVSRDLAYEIHSIRKKITAAKNVVYDTDGNQAHHADKFWSLALACWAGKQEVEQEKDPQLHKI